MAGELAGTTVTMVSAQDEATAQLVERSMAPFEGRTGIDVVVVPIWDGFEEFVADSQAANTLPDIVQFPQPGFLAELARQGEVVDVRTFLDDAYLRQQYPEDLLELATVGDQMAGVWYAVSVKSLVWYPKEAFEEAGYEVPQTWDELMALSEQIVADGRDYDFFPLPPIDPEYGNAVLGSGDIQAMFNDRPEVREVMRYLTTGESAKYLVQAGGYISPHRDTPFDWYSSPADLRFAQMVLEADTYRYDGSDLMPPEVGVDAFWKGIVDWVEGDDLETVLQDIDSRWPDQK